LYFWICRSANDRAVGWFATLPATNQLTVRTTDGHEWSFGPDRRDLSAVVTGPAADLLRWLAGRGPISTINVDAEPAVAEQLHAFIGSI
jgi:hypothetical protein